MKIKRKIEPGAEGRGASAGAGSGVYFSAFAFCSRITFLKASAGAVAKAF